MTIKDLLDQGIQLQGYVLIRKYREKSNSYITLFEGQGETINNDTDGLYGEIKYMYSKTESNLNPMYPKSGLYIEVE